MPRDSWGQRKAIGFQLSPSPFALYEDSRPSRPLSRTLSPHRHRHVYEEDPKELSSFQTRRVTMAANQLSASSPFAPTKTPHHEETDVRRARWWAQQYDDTHVPSRPLTDLLPRERSEVPAQQTYAQALQEHLRADPPSKKVEHSTETNMTEIGIGTETEAETKIEIETGKGVVDARFPESPRVRRPRDECDAIDPRHYNHEEIRGSQEGRSNARELEEYIRQEKQRLRLGRGDASTTPTAQPTRSSMLAWGPGELLEPALKEHRRQKELETQRILLEQMEEKKQRKRVSDERRRLEELREEERVRREAVAMMSTPREEEHRHRASIREKARENTGGRLSSPPAGFNVSGPRGVPRSSVEENSRGFALQHEFDPVALEKKATRRRQQEEMQRVLEEQMAEKSLRKKEEERQLHEADMAEEARVTRELAAMMSTPREEEHRHRASIRERARENTGGRLSSPPAGFNVSGPRGVPRSSVEENSRGFALQHEFDPVALEKKATRRRQQEEMQRVLEEQMAEKSLRKKEEERQLHEADMAEEARVTRELAAMEMEDDDKSHTPTKSRSHLRSPSQSQARPSRMLDDHRPISGRVLRERDRSSSPPPRQWPLARRGSGGTGDYQRVGSSDRNFSLYHYDVNDPQAIEEREQVRLARELMQHSLQEQIEEKKRRKAEEERKQREDERRLEEKIMRDRERMDREERDAKEQFERAQSARELRAGLSPPKHHDQQDTVWNRPPLPPSYSPPAAANVSPYLPYTPPPPPPPGYASYSTPPLIRAPLAPWSMPPLRASPSLHGDFRAPPPMAMRTQPRMGISAESQFVFPDGHSTRITDADLTPVRYGISAEESSWVGM